jgi:hypothetical protein
MATESTNNAAKTEARHASQIERVREMSPMMAAMSGHQDLAASVWDSDMLWSELDNAS